MFEIKIVFSHNQASRLIQLIIRLKGGVSTLSFYLNSK